MVRRLLVPAATIIVVALVVLDALAFLGWPDGGPIALAQVLAGHLTLLAVLIIPAAFLREAGLLRWALAVLALLTILRFGGEWWSFPSGVGDDTARLDVMTWNLEMGARPPADAVAFLRSGTARVVAMQELTPDTAAAVAADPVLAKRYPYQALYPSPDVLGLGLLSTDPLTDVRFDAGPSRLFATVTSPIGAVRVVEVHPLHGVIAQGPLGLPMSYDVAERWAALGRISDAIAADDLGASTLVLGDINTAPTEPEFGRFIARLSAIDPHALAPYRDAHAEVGLGPGWTYRPDALEPLGIGLLRIDVVLTGPGLHPVAETTRCPPAGDHCAVLATVVAGP